MVDVRHERREPAAVDELRAGERHRPVGAAVERPEERDHAVALGVPAGELQRRLDGLRPAVGEEHLLRRRAGGDLRQPLRQVDLRAVVEVGAAHVEQLARLILDGGDDFRVTVAGVGDRDAGGEVEEEVAVHVLNDGPAAALDEQRVHAACTTATRTACRGRASPRRSGRGAACGCRERGGDQTRTSWCVPRRGNRPGIEIPGYHTVAPSGPDDTPSVYPLADPKG